MSDSNVSRRDFIQKAAMITGVGLAAGGALAVGKGLWDSNQSAATEVESLQARVADSATQIALLQQSLAAVEAELAQLRPDYAAVLSKNAELQNALTAKQQEADAVRVELVNAQARALALSQLVALYEKLEANDLDSLLDDGLAAAAAGFAGALGILPLVADGLRTARTLFDVFENQFPDFRAGLDWLQQHMDGMNESMGAVESAIEKAVSTLDPLVSRMSQLVKHILAYLPANIGAAVKGALDAIDLLYQSLPTVISGAHTQVINMLGEPFAENEKGLKRTLLNPVREKSLAPTEKLTAQIKSLNETYKRSLHDPARQAIEGRASVKKEIADFRAANQV